MTGFKEEVFFEHSNPKVLEKPMWVCGGGGDPIQCWRGMLSPTSFFPTSDDDDDNVTFSSPFRILSFCRTLHSPGVMKPCQS